VNLVDVVVETDLQGVGLLRNTIENAADELERLGRFLNGRRFSAVVAAVGTAIEAALIEFDEVLFQVAVQLRATFQRLGIRPAVLSIIQSSLAAEVLLDDAALALDVSASLLDQVPGVILGPDHSAGRKQRNRRQAEEGESPRDPPRAKNG
jgi:hypothetical protein